MTHTTSQKPVASPARVLRLEDLKEGKSYRWHSCYYVRGVHTPTHMDLKYVGFKNGFPRFIQLGVSTEFPLKPSAFGFEPTENGEWDACGYLVMLD